MVAPEKDLEAPDSCRIGLICPILLILIKPF
jgi:hypothetical protein